MPSNPYLQELYKQCLNRYSVDSVGMTTSDWLIKNTKLKGMPFSFGRYPYQREVIDDNHPNQVGIKPSQVGWSEIIHRWSLAFLTRNRNTKGIYAYPDDDMRKKNVQTRILPLIDNNKVFNLDSEATEKPVRSIQLIQIGTSFMYVTGSKEGDATSTDADFVVIDEYDLHDPDMTTLFRSRVLNSDWKIIKNFSTPTYTEFGVDQTFTASDQMYYLIKCGSCNHWQFPLFNPHFIEIGNLPGDINDLLEIDQGMIDTFNLDLENSYVCCEKCRAPLDLGREDNRAWVAKYPSRTHLRGRRINPFSVSTRPPMAIITELLEFKRKNNIKGFKNTILGEAEDSSSARISEAAIRACMTTQRLVPAPRKDIPAFVGIDMGHTCHLVLGLGYTAKAVSVVMMRSFPINQLLTVVTQLMQDYNLHGGMVDRHPESLAANDARDASHNIILPCEYRGEKELQLIEDAEKNIIYCQANRTILLDAVKMAVERHEITFSGYGVEHEANIVIHLRNMVREESPEVPAVWRKLDSQDHFFHATGFMLKAMSLSKLKELKNGVPQTTVCVAAADIAGYNSDIFGNKIKAKAATPWQTQFLRL